MLSSELCIHRNARQKDTSEKERCYCIPSMKSERTEGSSYNFTGIGARLASHFSHSNDVQLCVLLSTGDFVKSV